MNIILKKKFQIFPKNITLKIIFRCDFSILMPQRWSSYDAEYSAASNLTERITQLYYFTSYSIPVLYTAITPYSNLFPRRKQQSFDCLSTCNVSLPAFSASCFQMTHQKVQMWLLSLTFNDFQLLSDEGPIFSLTFSSSGYFPPRLFYCCTPVESDYLVFIKYTLCFTPLGSHYFLYLQRPL